MIITIFQELVATDEKCVGGPQTVEFVELSVIVRTVVATVKSDETNTEKTRKNSKICTTIKCFDKVKINLDLFQEMF